MEPIAQYETLDELFLDAAQGLLEHGAELESRDGPTMEICGYTARLLNPHAHFVFNPERNLSPAYAAAELIWYLAGKDDPAMILEYAPQYERFCNRREDGSLYAHGHYGARWSHTLENGRTQLATVIRTLKKNPESRQAILTCWDRDTDLVHAERVDRGDIPCTLSVQFLVRGGNLNCIVTMRSNDIWLGLPYDIFAFTCLQMMVASALGLSIGWYQHQAGSLHLYHRNREKCERAASVRSFNTGPLSYQLHVGYVSEKIAKMVELEEHNRKTKCCTVCTDLPEHTLFYQLLAMAASKWTDVSKKIQNPLMKRHLERE